ncbi:MAG TPA: YfhO family protein, partial [Longimicrobium sp.]|uniref:YfhO family protein n=1 Tax=Longimicrobium sp. TaxID=2029185 RepID=UPI002ED8153C
MTKTAPPPRRPSPLAAPAADREPAPGAGLAAALYFGLALVYFLPGFLPGRQMFGTDYMHAGYFFYEFIDQRMAAGHLPGWVPYVYGGVPLFSNPGSTYYPIRFLAELGPTRLFLPVLFWFQFGVAGWGMYLLGREMGCRRWVAFVVGLAFQWTGILSSWVYAGHDGRIIVASLAPLLFYFLHRGIRTGRVAPFAGAAATVAFALLSFQIQNAWYLLLAAAIWSLFLLFALGVHRDRPRLARTVGLGIAAVGFGFVAAAVNFLPFQDYVGQSPRGMTGGRGYEYSTSFSMPLRAVAGLAAPEQVGANVQNEQGEYILPVYRGENAFRLHTEYVGALVLLLFAAGVAYSRRNRYWLFFAGLGLFALTLSLGGNTPIYHLYYEVLPGLKRFRAPDLAYYVLAFSLISMAAVTLERLAEEREARAARRVGTAETGDNRLAIAIAAVVGIAVLAAMTWGAASGGMAEGTSGLTPSLGWMRFALFAGLIGGALWAWWARSINTTVAMVLLSVLTVADLWVIGKKFMQTVDGPETMFAEDDITAFFRAQQQREGPFRVFPLPGQSAWPATKDYPMRFGIDQIGGEHGNQLQRYNEFAGAGKETYVDFHNVLGDARFLAASNARYIVASTQFQDPMLREAYRGQNALVYENLAALPRAYLAQQVIASAPGKSIGVMQNPSWDPRTQVVVEGGAPALAATPLQGSARVTAYEPDRVVVQTTSSRPAMMVLADNWYADWHATVNGREVPVRIANHTFRAVEVPAGNATVEFTFRPAQLYTGFRITLACFGLLALYGLYLLASMLRRRRTPV